MNHLYVYIYPFFFGFSSHLSHHRALIRVPWAIWWILVSYLFYEVKLVSQSGPSLCDPMGCRLPGSSVPGILQARILGCAAVPFSRGSSRPRDRTLVSCIVRWILYRWAIREAPIYFTHRINSICMSVPVFQFTPLSASHGVHTFILYFCSSNRIIYTIFLGST